jgi:hypothetical protein
MSIVKEIIELLGGELQLHSELGAGTEVTMWLPVAQPNCNTVPTAEAASLGNATSGKNREAVPVGCAHIAGHEMDAGLAG